MSVNGIYKSLQPKDVKITPFQSFREVTVTSFNNPAGFYSYDTEYDLDSSYGFQYPGHTSIDVGAPNITSLFDATTNPPYPDEYFLSAMHQQIDAMYYRHYLSHNHSTPDNTNINFQYRDYGWKARVISCPRRQIGEGILPTSLRLTTNGNATLIDDGYGNVIISSSAQSTYRDLLFSLTFNRYYKFIDEPTGNQYQPLSFGGCRLQSFMKGVTFEDDVNGLVNLVVDNSRVDLKALENPQVKQLLNFTNRDFAIAFKATGTGTLLTKQVPTEEWTYNSSGSAVQNTQLPSNYPYKITLNGGIATFTKSGGGTTLTVPGNTANAHIVIQRVGDTIQIYSNGGGPITVVDPFIDATGCGSSDILCANNSNLVLGCNGDDSNPLDGTVSYLHIFDRALTADEVIQITDSGGRIDGYCGNVFYNTGMIVLTGPVGMDGKNNPPKQMRFNSTVTLLETQVFCTVGPGDFTRTLNPTTFSWNAVTNQLETACRYTGSAFRPYVTTVGLYDDMSNLVAVGKLSTPVQTSRTTDTTFVVKFDR